MSAGLDHARGNAVLLIDADFQHPLAMVAEMVQLWNSGYDMIYGVIADRAAESPLKRWGTNVFYYLMNKGYTNVTNMKFGMARWVARGFPIQGDPGELPTTTSSGCCG